MKISVRRLSWMMGLVALPLAAWATCGGGGGGGRGGAVPDMGSAEPVVYHVSWQLDDPDKPLGAGLDASLLVLWFAPSGEAVRGSDLLASRVLAQANERCVVTLLVPVANAGRLTAWKIAAGEQVVVLADANGMEIGRVNQNPDGSFDPRAVEKMVQKEIAAREKRLAEILKVGEKKAKAADKSAMDELKQIWAQRCLYPKLGKRAAKALEKLGIKVVQDSLQHLGPDELGDPDVDNANARVESLLAQGQNAEIAGTYRVAEGFYREAVELDPADTTAWRYLGEFYRHQTGEWDKAGRIFNRILMQPSDPIARAVALHGLGKMTIHAGRFKAGLALFEQSLAAYPLPITYRNLAVYWFSEKQEEKAAGYMRQALALDPADTYNQIFAAVYLAAAGHRDEALKIAQTNESVLEASYNLAAIYAQAGDRAKAMELLKRHFYAYERYEAVRAMEMKEARDDYMFANLHQDPEFLDATRFAKSAYLVGSEFCSPDALIAQPAYSAPMTGSAGKIE